jgi:NAD(P)H-dependent flavin oxidoreductase YrpB (nitropropane dioxygenase family)
MSGPTARRDEDQCGERRARVEYVIAVERPAWAALAERLGIDVPIVQAPIGSATTPQMAAAVSRAGGLGTLALSWTEAGRVRDVIRRTRELTDRPIAVNLVLAFDQRERLAVCAQEAVTTVSTFWGDPGPYAERIHAAGATHVHTVGSVAEARAAVEAGVDVIVAQGVEAGGHVRGETSTRVLLPAVVAAIDPVPVLAAGGIADARGVAATVALGAAGVWVGTRFLLADEANVHPEYRRRLIAATGADTVLTSVFDGGWPDAPHRTLRNSTIARWELAGRPRAPDRPGEGDVVAQFPGGRAIARYHFAMPVAGAGGDIEAMALYAGEGCGLVRECAPAAAILSALARGLPAGASPARGGALEPEAPG